MAKKELQERRTDILNIYNITEVVVMKFDIMNLFLKRHSKDYDKLLKMIIQINIIIAKISFTKYD